MIHGQKPNGYTLSFNAAGKRIEAETRQCVHCQFMWSYGEPHPPDELDGLLGHPTRRGYCLRCGGHLCCRQACFEQQLRLIDAVQKMTGMTRSCVPYEEWNSRLREKLGRYGQLAPDMTITPSGLVVPKAVCG